MSELTTYHVNVRSEHLDLAHAQKILDMCQNTLLARDDLDLTNTESHVENEYMISGNDYDATLKPDENILDIGIYETPSGYLHKIFNDLVELLDTFEGRYDLNVTEFTDGHSETRSATYIDSTIYRDIECLDDGTPAVSLPKLKAYLAKGTLVEFVESEIKKLF